MGKLRFMWQNLADISTITASSEAAGYPVENIQIRWRTRHWRSTGVAAEWVMGDIGTPALVKAFIIDYHNFQPGAAVRFQMDSDPPDWAPPWYDEPLTISPNMIVIWLNETFQWWRVTMVGNPGGDPYFRIGRIFVGGFFETRYGYRKKKIISKDPSVIAYSTGGQQSSYEKEKYEEFDYEFSPGAILAADLASLRGIWTEVGRSKSYYVCDWSPSPSTRTYYVQNISDWPFDPLVTDYYGFGFSVETAR